MAAGNTYEAIATLNGTGSSETVTFSSIPATYTDLVLIVNPVFASNSSNINMRINGDTGSNYSDTSLYGNGASVFSGRDTNSNFIYISGTGTGVTTATRDNGIIQFMKYANTATYKTVLHRYNQPGQIVIAQVGLWRNTAAITSISLIASVGNFDSGTTFTLYGIKAA